MKFTFTAVLAVALAGPAFGFTSFKGPSKAIRSADTVLFLEPDALTDYMAKAHEEKLKAVRMAEEKKESEIQELRKQIEELKKSPPTSGAIVAAAPPTPSGDFNAMSNQQMATKLLSYQQFMAKYIVDAQQEKHKAVMAAELAMKNKYEAKLKLLGAASTPATPAPAPAPAVEKSLYEERNAKVAAAAKAGKSRWGDKENQKAAGSVPSIPSTPSAAPDVNGLPGVNGAVVADAVVSMPADQDLFAKRNSRVAAAGAAGKSRWGEKEVAKATKLSAALPSSPSSKPTPPGPVAAEPDIVVPPEVVAADHGLRNDGGVGGPSLAERINLGAQLISGSSNVGAQLVNGVTATAPAPTTTAPTQQQTGPSLYDKRNARIAAAGKAGKSRWGEMEIIKAQDLLASLPSSSSSSGSSTAALPDDIPISPEVEAADHGLRNDGGVGGPSLAQRINFGASILGQ